MAEEDVGAEGLVVRPRSKQGVPRVSLEAAEKFARGVWDAARSGEAPPVAVARAISGKTDTKPSGGAWRRKLTALRVFHLIEKLKTDNLKLSSAGLGVVNQADPNKQRQGRREAVMSVESYAAILNNNDGHELPPVNSLAGIFEYDYALSAADAKIATKAFTDSVAFAELVDEKGVIHLDGDYAPPQVSDEEDEDVDDAEVGTDTYDDEEVDVPLDEDLTPPPADPPDDSSPIRLIPPVPATGRVDLAVSLNMSKWDVADVLAVLRVLGYHDDKAS